MCCVQELVSIPTKSRDWKGIFISLVVIVTVMGLIQVRMMIMTLLMMRMMLQVTIQLATPPPGPPRLPTLRMEYSQLQRGHFNPNTFNATWVTGQFVLELQTNHRRSFHNYGEGPYLGLLLVESTY